ncbi:MAG: papain-like cysteine protease family protein [Planctomycetota bacterium]
MSALYSCCTYHVNSPNIDVIAQPSSKACWATVFTMMYGWKTGTCLTIETALSEVGPKWVEMFKGNKGLMPDDKKDFVAAAGLVAEPPMSLSVIGWEKMLRDYGPIWVTTDEAPGKPWAIHARIIVAIRGDGTPAGTKFKIIDPAGGKEYTETIETFVPKYEEEVRKTGYMRMQILHWPKDARYGDAKAMAASRYLRMPLAMEVPSNPGNYRQLTSGTWNSNTTLNVQGGQGMWFKVTNVNVLGTTIRISDNLGQSKGSVILPQTTVNFLFTCFGNEPMSWRFDIRSESDAFMVTWELWSTWAPGMPHNPPSLKGEDQKAK